MNWLVKNADILPDLMKFICVCIIANYSASIFIMAWGSDTRQVCGG